jgi:hypothetical protein
MLTKKQPVLAKKQNEKQELEIFGNTDTLVTQNFSIRPTKQMFKLLSDTMYSDKILAVIRELSANAHDSHVKANNEETPFTVHLPNALEPYFSIRDFGVGLSKDEIISLYTTYGSSSKQDDLTQVGFFGLGSKSPLAYTDQFTIRSFQNNHCHTWLCFMGEDGFPKVSYVETQETQEPNGLEIHFAVSEKDFVSFSKKAKAVFEFYETFPIVVGCFDFKLEPNLVVFSVKNTFYKMDYIKTSEHKDFKIVQGVCSYTISHRDLPEELKEHDWFFAQKNAVLHLPIGSVNVTGSRESLSFDQHTISTLLSVIEAYKKDLVIKIKKDLKTKKTLFDTNLYCCKLANIIKQSTPIIKLFDTIETRFKKIDDDDEKRTVSDFAHRGSHFKFSNPCFCDKTQMTSNELFADISVVRTHTNRGNALATVGLAREDVVFTGSTLFSKYEEGKKTFFIIGNRHENKKLLPTIKHFLNSLDTEPHRVYFINDWKNDRQAIIDRINLHLDGIYTVIKFEDLPEPPKVKRVSNVTPPKVKKLRFPHNRFEDTVLADPSQGGFYVNLKANQIDGDASHLTAYDLNIMISNFKTWNLLPSDFEVYGFHHSNKHILKNNNLAWKPLVPHLIEILEKDLKGVNFKKLNALMSENTVISQNPSLVSSIEDFEDVTEEFKKAFEYIKKIKQAVENQRTLALKADVYNKLKKVKPSIELQKPSVIEKMFEKIQEKYP